jgi:hypothetical protein
MESNLSKQLTPKQKAFCDYYLHTFNATQSAIQAGYSHHTALKGEILHIPKIQMYLQERQHRIANSIDINREKILKEIARVAFTNAGDFYNSDGSLKPLAELSDDARASIADLRITRKIKAGKETEEVHLKMHNKMEALDKLARHLGFYNFGATYKPQPEIYYYPSAEQGLRQLAEYCPEDESDFVFNRELDE